MHDAYNAQRAAAYCLQKARVHECIKINLLEDLIMMEIIPDCADINTFTNEQVTTWSIGLLDNEPQNLGDRVAEAIRKHRQIPNPLDPEAGVHELFFRIMTALRTVGGVRFMKDNAQAKIVITRLVNGLRTSKVRQDCFATSQIGRKENIIPYNAPLREQGRARLKCSDSKKGIP